MNIETLEPYECPSTTIRTFKNKPKSYVKNGKPRFAYVTLLFGGDAYLPAAINLAYSLKKQKTKADLVIMITPDVKDKARKILKIFFDQIIKIDYIVPGKGFLHQTLMKRFPHYEKQYTKLHIFRLTEYEKVVYLDADTIAMRHFDHLFTLDPPSTTYYGFRGERPHMVETNYIPRRKGDHYQWHLKYCQCCNHRSKIPNQKTHYGCDTFKYPAFVGISAELMVIEPNYNDFEDMMSLISENLEIKKYRTEASFLACYFSGQWNGIDPRFPGLKGYPHPYLLFGLSYGNQKPWRMSDYESDLRKDMMTWPYIVLWFYYFIDLVHDYPEVIKYPLLKDLNEEIRSIVKYHREKEIYQELFQFYQELYQNKRK